MADRFMIDCIHANLKMIPIAVMKQNQLAALYVTGSPDVKATPADFIYIMQLGLIPVTIDQGFTGSPIAGAMVRDVEPNAWTPANAINDKPWVPDRPTIYADRLDMTTVVNDGWTKDIWLAWPMDHIPTKDEILTAHPEYAKANLIGVQIGTTPLYDRSVIYDPDWPNLPEENTMIVIPGWPGKWLNFVFFDTPTATVLVGMGTDGDIFTAYRLHGTTVIHGPSRLVTT